MVEFAASVVGAGIVGGGGDSRLASTEQGMGGGGTGKAGDGSIFTIGVDAEDA